MTKKILIDASHAEETRVVVLDGSRLEDFDVETATRKQIKGNIYLAKVIRVEPSLQAAFVEYGGNRHGFLAFGEIHPDYYQIPVADRQRLLALQAEAAEEEAEEEAPAREFEATAESTAPEPELLEVSPGQDAEPAETGSETASAQALAVTSIDIISAPPPAGDEAAADEPVPALPETLEDIAAIAPVAEDADSQPPEEPAEAPIGAEAGEAIADAASLEGATLDGAALDGAAPEEATEATVFEESAESSEETTEFNGEDEPAQPPPESLGGDGDDAAEARERRQRQRFLRNYKIQEVIHRRQIMLIQVVKEERGNKGAALTTYLSLAGRFSVLMPNSPTGGGVSRKITSVADRRRLKEAVSELDVPQGMGLIVRTAGANRPKPEIKRDCEYLLRLWDDIRDKTLQSIAPALIYEEASLIKRTIRDVYSRDIDEIYVDGDEAFQAARDFMRMLMPSQARRVQPWTEGQPLFAKYQVESQLDAMLNPIVQLRSGGYIVINQTEALVAIDVNSGRSTRERSIEDTALRTNMEAAEEVARQLRIRDLAGLVVIDFIDMESRKNNAMVERKLKDALKNDRARIQVGSISHFGLMEMSRQRLRPSLTEASLVICPHCSGMGHVRSPESAALHVLRAVEDEGAKYRSAEIVVTLAPDIALYLFNHKRDRLSAIENRYAMRVIFTGDASLTAANFRIEKTKALTTPPPVPAPLPKATALLAEPVEVETEEENEVAEAGQAGRAEAGRDSAETAEEGERRRRRRRRRRGRRTEPGAAPQEGLDQEGLEQEGLEDAEFSEEPEQAAAPHQHADDDAPTEMDLILAAELGAIPEVDLAELPAEPGLDAAEASQPEIPLPEPAAPEQAEAGAEGGEKPRRRRTRGGRRRSSAATEAEDPAEPKPVVPEVRFADIADIFEAAERAEEAQRVKAHLAIAPEPDPELPPAVHVPEVLLEPVTHLVFEPVPAEPVAPEPTASVTVAPEPEPEPEPELEVSEPAALEPAALEPAALEPAAPGPAAEPLVKPVLVGEAPADKKRGWWRR